MKKQPIFLAAFCLIMLTSSLANAQAFRKGSLLVSVSEGATFANYGTSNTGDGGSVRDNITGDRDPLTIEYGLSNHWSVGITMGGDVFRVDPNTFYGIKEQERKTVATTSEITMDANYHYYITKRTDISAFASFGTTDVSFKGKEGDAAYQYHANGGMLRLGTKAKYYVFRRIGIMGMVSAFSGTYSPVGVKENTIAGTTNTKIKGVAVEFGICARFLK